MVPSISSGSNALCERLHIQYPIFQGAMANIATPEFAAAVSQCGALGIIATGGMSLQEASDAIDTCRSLTRQPFGVNIMMMHPQAAELFALVAEKKVPVVTVGAGNPGPYMNMLKASGAAVIPVCASAALARRLERAGADAIIAEGCEAGGHIGETTTMALIPQIADAVNIPVIAAGGIADGRGFAAALCLGAAGIQIGTCLLATAECPIHENYKQAVIKAQDRSTTVTGRRNHAPVRILKNAMAREYLKRESEGASLEELETLTLGSLRKAVFQGDVQEGSVMMGQIAGLCHDIVPLSERIQNLVMGVQNVQQDLARDPLW